MSSVPPEIRFGSLDAYRLKIGRLSLEENKLVGVVVVNGRLWQVPDGVSLDRVKEFEASIAGTAYTDPERLVYADWLEIHGWPERAEDLRRKATEIDRYVCGKCRKHARECQCDGERVFREKDG